MLVLSRKKFETVKLHVPGLPDPIVVSVQRTGSNAVRIGFEADPTVAIRRGELAELTNESKEVTHGVL